MDFTQYVDNTKSVKQQVIEAYYAGAKLKEISSTFEISMGKIYTYVNSSGEGLRYESEIMPRRLKHLSKADIQSVITAYESRKPLEEIQEKYKLNKNGLYYILDTYGIPRRKQRAGKEGTF